VGTGKLQSLSATVASSSMRVTPTVRSCLGSIGRAQAGSRRWPGRVAEITPNTAVVHTDDVACIIALRMDRPTDRFSIEPLRSGRPVHFRPPGWDANARPGAIEVAATLPCHHRGVGVARPGLAEHLTRPSGCSRLRPRPPSECRPGYGR